MDYSRAANIAARLGQLLAIMFGFIGLFSNSVLIFRALFVWISAAQEDGRVRMNFKPGGFPMQRVMITDFRTLAPSDLLSPAVEYVLADFQQDFPVVEADGRQRPRALAGIQLPRHEP